MTKRTKKVYMEDETFAEMIESAEQALEYESGAREGYRITRVAIRKPPQPMSGDKITEIRKRRNHSQSVFVRAEGGYKDYPSAWEEGEGAECHRAQTPYDCEDPEVLLEE